MISLFLMGRCRGGKMGKVYGYPVDSAISSIIKYG